MITSPTSTTHSALHRVLSGDLAKDGCDCSQFSDSDSDSESTTMEPRKLAVANSETEPTSLEDVAMVFLAHSRMLPTVDEFVEWIEAVCFVWRMRECAKDLVKLKCADCDVATTLMLKLLDQCRCRRYRIFVVSLRMQKLEAFNEYKTYVVKNKEYMDQKTFMNFTLGRFRSRSTSQ